MTQRGSAMPARLRWPISHTPLTNRARRRHEFLPRDQAKFPNPTPTPRQWFIRVSAIAASVLSRWLFVLFLSMMVASGFHVWSRGHGAQIKYLGTREGGPESQQLKDCDFVRICYSARWEKLLYAGVHMAVIVKETDAWNEGLHCGTWMSVCAARWGGLKSGGVGPREEEDGPFFLSFFSISSFQL